MKSTAVIINEFGEIGIDHLLVEASTEQMVELNNVASVALSGEILRTSWDRWRCAGYRTHPPSSA